VTVTLSCSSRHTYTEETINGLRYIHNIEPLWGTEQKVTVKFRKKYGELNTDDERYQFYYPKDVAVDNRGNIYILDAGNHKIKIYDKEGTYLRAFGRKGSGPGEFIGATRLEIFPEGNILINDLATNAVTIFDRSGRFIRRIRHEGLSPIQILALRSGEIAVFSVRRFDTEHIREMPPLVSILDQNGTILRKFGSPRLYEDPPTNFWCNSAHIAGDDADNIYINFESQNRIEKFSSEGELLFKADRLLGYAETMEIEKSVHVYDEGPLIAVSFNIFSAGIQVDHIGRIWSGTLRCQKDPDDKRGGEESRREGGRPEDYMFEIYDQNGVLLGRIQEADYYGQRFRIVADRLFLVDSDVEMAVVEYRIVDN
jgi:hypothetical protein